MQAGNGNTIYDFCIDASTGAWALWALRIEESTMLQCQSLSTACTIDHADTVRYRCLLESMLESGKV